MAAPASIGFNSPKAALERQVIPIPRAVRGVIVAYST